MVEIQTVLYFKQIAKIEQDFVFFCLCLRVASLPPLLKNQPIIQKVQKALQEIQLNGTLCLRPRAYQGCKKQ